MGYPPRVDDSRWTAAATTLLDEVYAFLRAARWRARIRSWTAASTTLLDEVYYPTSDPAADFGPGPEPVAEGRAAIPGICFSASLTADFGPSPEGAAEGCRAGRGICFLQLSPPTSGLARRERRRGAQLDRGFAFSASRRQHWALPGGGGGGVHSSTGSFLSMPLAGAACERGSLLFIVFGSRPLLRPGNNGEGACGQRVCIPAPLATEFGLMEAWLGCYVADRA